jgi:hypothetical protein
MIDALKDTGAYLKQHALERRSDETKFRKLNDIFYDDFETIIMTEFGHNGWFIESNIRKALGAIADSLCDEQVAQWMKKYPKLPQEHESPKTVGVVMAGNIPLVGFHDMISVLMSGNTFLGKPSSKDDRLIRKVGELISYINPGFSKRIKFTEEYLKEVDAIIATGSDNSSRYFEYYFKDIPHIIRKNRNGLAILNGNESEEELLKLGEDIFSYFGLGCRNITKIYIPENYELPTILKALESFMELANHHKYINNIEYHRSVYLMNSIDFFDNGVILMKEDQKLSSPIGVVYFEKYSQLENVLTQLEVLKDQIQCVITTEKGIEGSILPGSSQNPKLWDYADGVDTMEFLSSI